MAISSVIKACGNGQVPGVKQRVYFVPKGDITTFATGNVTTAYGDTKVFNQDFTLDTGKKWLELDILIATGDVVDTIQGEVGGQYVRNAFVFFVPDYNKEQRMLVDDMIANSGCLIFLVPGKDGKVSVVGNLENPCYVEQLTGGVGGAETNRTGIAMRVYADTGYSCPIYTGTIDLTA
jgi:hypothetical protein